MNKEDWLQEEVNKWIQADLIDITQAEKIKALYPKQAAASRLNLIFAIVGSLLIGAGIILILAKNWYLLPFGLRAFMAFLPLILAQAIAVWVILRKYSSSSWREGSALFWFLSIFSTTALVGQVFHLAGDLNYYLITCALLGLPILYILQAFAPVPLYLGAIIVPFWGYNALETIFYPILLLLILPLLIYQLKQKPESLTSCYLSWIAAWYGILVLFLFYHSSQAIAILFLYFGLLYLTDSWIPRYSQRSYWSRPFKICGTLGLLFMFFFLSWESFWPINEYSYLYTRGETFFPFWCGCLALGIYTIIKKHRRDWLNFSMIVSFLFMSLLYYSSFYTSDFTIAYALSLLDNLVLFFLSVVFIITGVRRSSFTISNAGMGILLFLVALRFFDSNLHFLVRGIVFVLLGAVFLLLNYRLSRLSNRRKST